MGKMQGEIHVSLSESAEHMGTLSEQDFVREITNTILSYNTYRWNKHVQSDSFPLWNLIVTVSSENKQQETSIKLENWHSR